MNVALIIFNRPRHVEQVLKRIALARPDKLFIIGDGPRPGVEGEQSRVEEARAEAAKITWPCEVFTNYSPTNLGCGIRPYTGITWVFENVDRCIILEDDCLPDVTFFLYCEELLGRYADDSQVVGISGDNFHENGRYRGVSYHFSIYPLTWGWATWSRAWRNMDFELKGWNFLKSTSWLKDLLQDEAAARYWAARFDYAIDGKQTDIWDIAWVFSCFRSGGGFIHPYVNLVQNIGWGELSTHTNEASRALNIAAKAIRFPITHPEEVSIDRKRDRFLSKHVFVQKPPICDMLISRYTYGAIIRSMPLIGRMWAAWRK